MNVLQGSLVIIDLGTDNVKYLWKGVPLKGIINMFVYKGTSITLTCKDKNLLPMAELKAYGIKIKEQK